MDGDGEMCVHSLIRSIGKRGRRCSFIKYTRGEKCWLLDLSRAGVSKWGSGTMRKNEEEKMTDGEKKYIWPVPDQS